MSAEFDLGLLSRDERAMVAPRGEIETIVGWLYESLYRAGQSRLRLPRIMRGTFEYGAENYRRHQAVEQAKRHAARLRTHGADIPDDLAAMMRAEGLAP